MSFMRAFLLSMLILFLARPAYAYIDPGTGTMIIQAIVAVIVAGGIFWRRILYFLKKLINKGKKRT